MDSVETEFFRARLQARLSIEDAALLLEVSENDVDRLDAGNVQPTTRQVSILNGFSLGIAKPQSGRGQEIQIEPTAANSEITGRSRKSELGQFFTPVSIADFMAGLFSPPIGNVRLLDAGAGTGTLTSAFLDKWQSSSAVTGIEGAAFECDVQILQKLRDTLALRRNGKIAVISGDFLEHATASICLKTGMRYSRAILNPPYKKIGASSSHRALVRKAGFETVNLYSAFVGLALALLDKGGELVAIIPRSFCNGPYYLGFRKFILAHSSIQYIHVFGKRNEAFAEDGVLQENVILKLVASEKQGPVAISTSSDHRFSDYSQSIHPFSDVVVADDEELFIHIPTAQAKAARNHQTGMTTLDELNLSCSTGPVVDFRVKEALRQDFVAGSVPLLYPAHFSSGQLSWPKVGFRKSNAIDVVKSTENSLWEMGHYTVVRRFSAKEERRRVYAAVVEPAKLPTSRVGFENHLNVYHCGKKPMEPQLAWGLAAYLNSTHVDDQLRSFSGHTQVNATDLRKLRYPTRERLEQIGAWYSRMDNCDQNALDNRLEALLR